jgi:hypothetical protein
MAKKIAVLVRGRQSEALRMSLGLTLVDDIVDVYVMDNKLEQTEQNTSNLELMREMEIKLYSNDNLNEGMQYCSSEDIAQKLLGYDHVLPY